MRVSRRKDDGAAWKTGERYVMNVRQWVGLFGTGGWDVPELYREPWWPCVPVYADSVIRFRRGGGHFFNPETGIHDTEYDLLEIVKGGNGQRHD